VAYALAGGGIVPMLFFTYFSGPEILDGSYTQYYADFNDNYLLVDAPMDSKGGVFGVSNGPGSSGNLNNVAMIEIKPEIALHFNANQSLTFVYAFQASVGSEDVYFSNGNATINANYFTDSSNSKVKTNNVIQVNYIMKF
jgi:hypothetical protein